MRPNQAETVLSAVACSLLPHDYSGRNMCVYVLYIKGTQLKFEGYLVEEAVHGGFGCTIDISGWFLY